IAHYFPLHIFAEQLGDLGRFGAAAHAAQKLLREAKGIVLTHGYFLTNSQTVGIVPPSITNSLPVMAEALSDARKTTSSAASSGRFGRPKGIPPSMSMSFCRATV